MENQNPYSQTTNYAPYTMWAIPDCVHLIEDVKNTHTQLEMCGTPQAISPFFPGNPRSFNEISMDFGASVYLFWKSQ